MYLTLNERKVEENLNRHFGISESLDSFAECFVCLFIQFIECP